jgi:hypothetical protein
MYEEGKEEVERTLVETIRCVVRGIGDGPYNFD